MNNNLTQKNINSINGSNNNNNSHNGSKLGRVKDFGTLLYLASISLSIPGEEVVVLFIKLRIKRTF